MGNRASRRLAAGILLAFLALWVAVPWETTHAQQAEQLLLPLLYGRGSRPAEPTPTSAATVQPTPTATPSETPVPGPAAPDGRISYVSLTFWQSLAIRSADGADVDYPTDLLGFSDRPVWSPDGAWLAYSGSPHFSGEGDCDWGVICVMDPAARVQWPLTPNGMRGERPTWSPDGAMVAFMVAGADGWDIGVAAADGGWMETVVASSGNDLHPTWSPDGRRLAYLSDRQGPGGHYGSVDLYVVDLDSGEDRLVLDLDADIGEPRWSPADERIALVASVDGAYEVMAVDADGANLRNLTDHAAADRGPVWSPDGTRIAWVSDRDGQDDVFVMDADGSRVVNVSRNPDPDMDPAWSPDGHWLTYVAFETPANGSVPGRVPRVRVVRADGEANHLFAEGANPQWGPSPDPGAPPLSPDPDPPVPAIGSSPAPVPTADAAGWLVYGVLQGEGEWGFHMRDLASGDVQFLATLEGRTAVLAFDGARVAIGMVQEYPGLWELYLANIEGGEPELVVLGEHPDVSLHRLDWHPNGRLLAVSEGLLDYQQAVHVLDPGEPPEVLDEVRVTPAREFYSAGAWWPDGSRLVLSHAARAPGVWAGSIVTINHDGTGYTLLLPRATDEGWPVPSPDGRRIAYVSDANGDSDVYVMDADGRNVVNLTHHPAGDWYPVWSPDGEEIAFRSTRAGDEAIYVLSADGTNLRRLTAEDTGSGPFAWVSAPSPTLPAPTADR